MRQSQRRLVAAGTVAVCVLVGSLGLGAQAGEPISPGTVRTIIAAIQSIDPDTFSITLDSEDADRLFAAPPAVRALIKLRAIGDRVSVTFYESRVVALTLGGGGTLPPGVRPGQTAAVRPALRDGTVTAV